MSEFLKKIREIEATETDVPQDLIDKRFEEIRAKRIVAPCCKEASRIVFGSAQPGVRFSVSPDPTDEGRWVCGESGMGPIRFCPFCSATLPNVRRKPELRTVESLKAAGVQVSEDGYRCAGCGENWGCLCDPPETAFEVVSEKHTFHRHVILSVKGHYPTRTLAQVIAAVAFMESRFVSSRDVAIHVVETVFAVLKPKPQPLFVHVKDDLVRACEKDTTLLAELKSSLRQVAVKEIPFDLGKPDADFRLEDGALP